MGRRGEKSSFPLGNYECSSPFQNTFLKTRAYYLEPTSPFEIISRTLAFSREKRRIIIPDKVSRYSASGFSKFYRRIEQHSTRRGISSIARETIGGSHSLRARARNPRSLPRNRFISRHSKSAAGSLSAPQKERCL